MHQLPRKRAAACCAIALLVSVLAYASQLGTHEQVATEIDGVSRTTLSRVLVTDIRVPATVPR